jgi:hypothetical protein
MPRLCALNWETWDCTLGSELALCARGKQHPESLLAWFESVVCVFSEGSGAGCHAVLRSASALRFSLNVRGLGMGGAKVAPIGDDKEVLAARRKEVLTARREEKH